MFLLDIFFFLLMIYGHQVNGKICPDDCIKFQNCPNAVNLIMKQRTAYTEQLVKDSFCGSENVQGHKSVKVCCSDFRSQEKDEIERHPNILLLPDSCGNIANNRLLGGTATLYEFPWMALIAYHTREGAQFLCGGSIINSRYVLTAAHCVRDKKIAGVRIGEYDIRYSKSSQGQQPQLICESHIQDMLVEEQIIQEQYQDSPAVVNDIALLRLKKPIDFSYKNAGPICLPISAQLRNVSLDGKTAVVAGWGLKESDTSSVLVKDYVPIQSMETCLRFLNKSSMPSDTNADEICAGELHKDSCHGDSGGPLMLEEEYKGVLRIVQYGIVSRGPKRCNSGVPGVYTNVTKFMKWILDNIKP